MLNKRKKAATPQKVTALNKIKLSKAYQSLSPDEREKAVQKIVKRISETPKIYHNTYDKAISGKSLRSAVNSFCLHCSGDLREEVRLCTGLACPLWPYRPYQDIPKLPSEGPVYNVESTNTDMRG